MQAIGLRPKVQVSADGAGVVGHAGTRLLADLADATGPTAAYSAALRPLRPRGTGHDPGRIATDQLRYRLLHVAARLTRGGRRLRLRISATWPWRHELATAFHRLTALPRPAG